MKSGALKTLLPHQYYQLVVAIIVTIPMISDGMQYSWSSPILPRLRLENSPIKISAEDETWLESAYLVAALAGLPITPLLVDILGRQKLILIASTSSMIAWIVMGFADTREYLYAGRVIGGAASDLIFVTVPMYIAEIADAEIRGFLTGLVYVMMVIGIIIMYSIAPFVPLYVPSIVGTGLLLIHLVTFYFMPESPYFLIARGKLKFAQKSIQKLKGLGEMENEVKTISNTLDEKNVKCHAAEAITKRSTLKSLAFITLLNSGQHFSGFSVVLMNLHTILNKANTVYLDANTTGIIIALIQLVAVLASSFTVDKYGRKSLLISSSIFTGISLLGLGVYFHVQSLQIDIEQISWLPILFAISYTAAFNVGLGVVPKIMASELFSSNFKALGMTYGDAMYVISGFLSLILYNYLVHNQEMYFPFYIFGSISFVVAIFTGLVIPETKGKSLEEIQKVLEK